MSEEASIFCVPMKNKSNWFYISENKRKEHHILFLEHVNYSHDCKTFTNQFMRIFLKNNHTVRKFAVKHHTRQEA